jgi:hypothetical protein
MADNLIPLIMMTQNDHALSQSLASGLDPLMHFCIGHHKIIF